MSDKSKHFFYALIAYGILCGALYRPYMNCACMRRIILFCGFELAASAGYVIASLSLPAVSPAVPFPAGLLFAFNPFAAGLGYYHPVSILIYAAVCWSLLPASCPKCRGAGWCAIAVLLPLATTAAIFFITTAVHIFPVPLSLHYNIGNLLSFITPMSDIWILPQPGIYRVGLVLFIVGLFTCGKSFLIRFIVLSAAAILSFVPLIDFVPPIFWMAPVIALMALTAGMGAEKLIQNQLSTLPKNRLIPPAVMKIWLNNYKLRVFIICAAVIADIVLGVKAVAVI